MNDREPAAGNKILYRKRISDLLQEGSRYRLTSIIAGPGYGKTIAVRDFCKTLPHPVIWLNLIKIDNNEERFWQDFTLQLGKAFPALSDSFEQLSYPKAMSELGEFLQILQKALDMVEKCTLVFDNMEHMIKSEAMEFINLLIESEPKNLGFIIISNKSLEEMHAMGEENFYAITSRDLLFSPDEFRELCALNQREFTKQQIIDIMEETEGWPLALSLMYEKTPDEIKEFRLFPRQKVIIEMFWHNYYKGYSEKMRSLLVRLSLLPFFTESLLRVYTGDAYNVDAILYKLPLDMFVSYDMQTGIFTFHCLYKEFLQERKKGLTGEQITETYQKAGDWFLEHQFFNEALDCFWKIKNYYGFLKVLSAMPVKKRSSEIAAITLKRLNAFPEQMVIANPVINFHRGIMVLNNMQINHAREIFTSLSTRLESELDTQIGSHEESWNDPAIDEKVFEKRQLLGDIYMLLSDIGFIQNSAEMFSYIRKASSIIKRGSHMRNSELQICGNNSVFFLTDYGENQLKAMEENIFTYAKLIEPIANGSGYGLELLFAAEAEFYIGRMDTAEEYAVKAATKAKMEEQHDIICNALFILIRVAIYRGEREKAGLILKEMKKYVDNYPVPGIRDIYDITDIWLQLRFSDVKDFPNWIKEKATAYAGKEIAGRERLMHVSFLLLSERYYEAYTVLLELEQLFDERGMFVLRVYGHIYKAIYYLITDQKMKVTESFYKAYRMLYKNNMTVLLEEFGLSMQKIIECVEHQDRLVFDLKWLHKVYTAAGNVDKRLSAMKKSVVSKSYTHRDGVSLTEREKEVLRLMAEGLSRNEIAAMLNITLNGVKKHISNIYIKLGAMNRTEAIRIGIANGLLKV